MFVRPRHLGFTLAPPLMAVGLLAGIVAEQRTHIQPTDAEPFHARARAGVDAVPFIVGYWTGRDDEITTAAQKLLRPNAILSRTYTQTSASGARRMREASLLIVQCRDSRDMIGHYPPVCYCAHGMTLDTGTPREWEINGMKIPGIEYHFSQLTHGELRRTTVYNFFCVPGRGLAADIKGVEEAAKDYQLRYYGAAQFQLVFGTWESTELSAAERDDVFATLLSPNLELIKTLTSGGLR